MTSAPRAASACAKAVMKGLCWPAPAPCPRMRAAPTRGSSAAKTSAVVCSSAATCTRSSEGFLTRVSNLRVRFQVVDHRHHAELAACDRPRQHPLHLALDHARQRHAAVLDDDVYWRIGHDRVVPEVWIAVNRTGDPIPEPVVELRDGQHGDLV